MLSPLNLIAILMTEQAASLADIANTIPRQARFPEVPNKIQVAIGMRRVGKTTFMLQHIHYLRTVKQVPLERILYISFEDDRLLPCDQTQFSTLLDAFYSLHPENHEHECYFFIDEIQNVSGWDLVIRRFFDKRNVHIYLSGSSAKMLSKEIATSLRGRSMTTEIWPYNFQEYLLAQSITLQGDYLSTQNQDILLEQLKLFLERGGFPEIIHQSLINSRSILQNYIELVIMRDIVERYHIKSITLIRYLVKTLLRNIGRNFTVNKFHNDIKSQKLEGSTPVIHDYLAYLEDAYFSFLVPLYDESLRKVQSNPRKIYAIDAGVYQAFSFDLDTISEKTYIVDSGLGKALSMSMSQNLGHLFENLIYLDLRRQGHSIYYALTQERYEIDFFTQNAKGEYCAYQVAWDVHDQETLTREQRALDALYAEKGIRGELITPQIYIEKIWHSMKNGDLYYL